MTNVNVNSIIAEEISTANVAVENGMSSPDMDIRGISVKNIINDIGDSLTAHKADDILHLTSDEHSAMTTLLSKFSFSDTSVVPLVATPYNLPRGSIKWQNILTFFARHCQDGTPKAPGKVYVSRVPYSTITTNASGQTTWAHIWSTLAQGGSVYSGLDAKIMDNAGLTHEGSTDLVEGVDDYVGKEWVFWWGHCNYTKDEFGQKHITAYKDIVIPGHEFDEKKNTGAFGPKFWFFCKPELYQYVDGDGVTRWTTDTGEKDGQPFTQLWGISDTRWSELSDAKRTELESHGITIADFHIWPECLVWDKVQNAYVERPYWIHSAYCGGWGYDDITGQPTLVSKKNAVLRRNMSYQALNAIYGAASGGKYPGIGQGGSACVNGFVTLFDVVKNATRFTQNNAVHNGMSYNWYTALPAYTGCDTVEADYIFPVAAAGATISTSQFTVGSTVYLRTSSTVGNQHDITNADRSISMQVGRVKAIEDRTFLANTGVEGDLPIEVTAKCIVLDPSTVEPFLVCTTYEKALAINNDKVYASNYIIGGFGMGGITDYVIGKHDGQCYSTASAIHTCRTQGTEFMAGCWQVAADTVAIVGDNTAVNIDGITYTPGDNYKVILQCPTTIKRHQNYAAIDGKVSIQTWLGYGYRAIGLQPNVGESYVANMGLTGTGVLLTTPGKVAEVSNTNSGSGVGDYFYNNISPAYAYEFLMSGSLNYSAAAGSAFLRLYYHLGSADWYFAARD